MNITWKALVDGDDIVVGSFTDPVTASWFGGPRDIADGQDDGETASGVPNAVMGVQGCSLPMEYDANGAHEPSCAGSPFGPIPWLTLVEVNALVRGPNGVPIVGVQKTVRLLDVGPDSYLNRPLDLCPQTFVDLGGNQDAGLIHVFFRVIGAGKYLKPA
jgi:hypothetical protein